MPQHVILLTDAHEAPATALIEVLREAGVSTLIEVLREAEVEVTAAVAAQREHEPNGEHASAPLPLAALYEIPPGADMVELFTAIEHVNLTWPGAPVIACRRRVGTNELHLRRLDNSTLRRLGFRAIA